MAEADTLESSRLDSDDPGLPTMSFLEHLEDLRRRLLYSIVSLAVAFLACWNYAREIYAWLEHPLVQFLPPGDKLAFTSVTTPFFLYMKVAFFAGIFVASPIILWQLWLFIAPGLYPREKRMSLPFILFATLFFLIGGYFGYRVVLPMAAKFFVEMGSGFKQVITVDDYFDFSSKLILGMGLVFETPVLILFLSIFGIVTPQFLLSKFKYAVVLIFIIAAVITPTPDMVTQSALAVPMILLYLFGIAISYVFGKKPDKPE
ncbi:MAG: twin-arginine translocase subunit TatC [Acidobacteriota bacterium]